jgi:hypothetical protein
MMDGRRLANASPVTIAGVYSVLPNLATKANADCRLSPSAMLVMIIITKSKGKYNSAGAVKSPVVDTVRVVATATSATSATLKRLV